MALPYPLARWALQTCWLLAPAQAAFAQAPAITSISPAANARAAVATSPVLVRFGQPLTPGSSGALHVFSSQRGGRRTQGATPATVSGSTLSFSPSNYAFLPGETVRYTVTQAAASSGGTLAQPRVGQFTAGVSASSSGIFAPGSDPGVGFQPTSVTVGDVDGDGDLDLLTANFRGGVSVRLNDGRGIFSGGQEVSANGNVRSVTVGDVDGDGDLDFVAPDYGDGTGTVVSVRLNAGNGTFSNGPNVAVGTGCYGAALGDVDGDGDLDLLTANGSGGVSVRLNSGSGTFSGSQHVPVGSNPHILALGDLDADGDLDFVTANSNSANVSVRLNDGSGTFGVGQNIATGGVPFSIALGDVDGDNDLDVLTADPAGMLRVRRNNGAGLYSGGQDIPVNGTGNSAFSAVLGDVDGDGDLDLLASNANNGGPGTVLVRLNNGSGTFSGSQDVSVGRSAMSVAVGDVDGDGDLDLLAANGNQSTVSVRLNGSSIPPTLRISGPAVLCTGQPVLLTATGTPTPLTYRWNTGATTPSITVTQPGTYSATAAFPGGPPASAQHVVVASETGPTLFLGRDTTLCNGSELVLQRPVGSSFAYRWSDGSTGASLRVREPGTYSLQVTTPCGTQTASRQVAYQPCGKIPNIITPNGDGRNDRFAITIPASGPWALAIYSRWGQRIYRSADYRNEWGAEAAPGVYYYLLQAADNSLPLKGWLEVVR